MPSERSRVSTKEFSRFRCGAVRTGRKDADMIRICFVTTIYRTYRCFLKSYASFLQGTGRYSISLICGEEEGIEKDVQSFVRLYQIRMKRGISLSGICSLGRIWSIFRENSFDIVQYSTPNAAFYSSVAGFLSGVPNRLYCQWGIRYMGFAGLRRRVFKFIERVTCRCSTFIEAESPNILRFSLGEKLYGEGKGCVVGHGSACGVDLTKFDFRKRRLWRDGMRQRYGIREGDVVFSFAARLTADKGINELLRAFAELGRDGDGYKLFVLGGMDDEGSLDKAAFAAARESGDVFFTGPVDNVEEYFSASDVFVSPSYREGFGLVVIEAGALGVPAIVTDVPGQVDAILRDVTGLTCEAKDCTSLRRAMSRLGGDGVLRGRMGAAARRFCEENFEQGHVFALLEEKLREILGGGLNCQR